MERSKSALFHPSIGWILACVLGGAWLLGAAGPAVVHVGLVDPDRVRMNSTSLQAELKAASGPAEAIQEKLKARQTELDASVKLYQTQESAASAQVNEQRQKDIDRLNKEVADLSKQMNGELAKAEQDKLEPMRKRVMDAIAAEAKGRGLEMVLTPDRVLYSQPAADLTDAVIARLDAPVKTPAP